MERNKAWAKACDMLQLFAATLRNNTAELAGLMAFRNGQSLLNEGLAE